MEAQRPSSSYRVPPRIVILHNHSEVLVKGELTDLRADQGVELCARAVAEALRAAGLEVMVAPITGDVEHALRAYSPLEWVIYNLGEGFEGRLFEEVRIAWALEAMGYRFTGSDAAALALSTHKARAKEALRRAGVPTPAWQVFCHPEQVTPEALAGLGYPLFVKPVAEDASLGITVDSVVHTHAALRARVGYIAERYRQAALVEAFVDGREINVALWGDPPEILPLSEVDFAGVESPYRRTVSFEAKWEPGSYGWEHSPVVCPARVERSLAERVHEVALRAWGAIGCKGYARMDLRVDRHGVPYVLEVNCNPDTSPDAGFFRSAEAGGYGYPEMVLRIVYLAVGEDVDASNLASIRT